MATRRRRAREKNAQRNQDATDLASGKRSAADIDRANNMFASLPSDTLQRARVMFPETD